MRKNLNRSKRFFKKHLIKLSLFLGLILLWIFCLPSPIFNAPTATVIESRDGEMLGARIAEDGQWRFPEMDSVPNRFEKCLLYFEDEYFYSHPGFNPISISKAVFHNFQNKSRRGGSTITQQVIRLSRKNKKRTYFEKAIEIFQATRLEAGYKKRSILNLYASHAPFGGNVVGLETAAWRYFGVPANELSWGQSAALAVLPNAPSLIFPGKNEERLKEKRDNLLLKLFQKKIIDKTTYELAIEEELPGKPLALPEHAPHLTEKIRMENPGMRLKTTINFPLQKKINAIGKENHYMLSQNHINNLAILILDVNTHEVLAYLGNAPTTKEHNNYVDIIDKPRSPGSLLKPFLYAAMLNSGEILPDMLVADIPTSVNGYTPENFDRNYNGAVPASLALSKSLNIPSVRMLREFGIQRFYNVLGKMNLRHIDKPADHYGLSLILGGAESSLWDITRAYSQMAYTLNFYNKTSSEYPECKAADPYYILSSEKRKPIAKTQKKGVFNAAALYKTFEALRQVNRPQGEESWEFFSSSQPVAWKTGTSYGFKDAWAVGVTPEYAIGVWVGNADGEGRPGLTGIQAAAPIFFEVLDALPNNNTPWFQSPYDELIEAEICAKSGYLKSIFCEQTKIEWIPKNAITTEACPFHHTIFLNKDKSHRVNSSCYPLMDMQEKSWFVLPTIMEFYYAPLHPEYKILPPFADNCIKDLEGVMDFIYPKRNETVLLPKTFDEEINKVVFKLAHSTKESLVNWYLDSEFVGQTQSFHELAISPKPGIYILTVVDNLGNELKEKIEIKNTR